MIDQHIDMDKTVSEVWKVCVHHVVMVPVNFQLILNGRVLKLHVNKKSHKPAKQKRSKNLKVFATWSFSFGIYLLYLFKSLYIFTIYCLRLVQLPKCLFHRVELHFGTLRPPFVHAPPWRGRGQAVPLRRGGRGGGGTAQGRTALAFGETHLAVEPTSWPCGDAWANWPAFKVCTTGYILVMFESFCIFFDDIKMT